MKHRLKIAIMLVVLAVLLLNACGPDNDPTININTQGTPANQALMVTDLVGRQVSLPNPARRVVAIGPGALRMYVYAGNLNYVIGVEQMGTGDVSGKPYMLANPGPGGAYRSSGREGLITLQTRKNYYGQAGRHF